MRLSAAEVDTIRRAAGRHFGEDCVVRLFGSRVDDRRRGGDIDLHIVAARDDLVTLDAEIAFALDVRERLGDQKVDVIVRRPHEPPRPIDAVALETGVRL